MEGKEQVPVTLKTSVEKKKTSLAGGGGKENGLQNPAQRKTERTNESHDRYSQLLGMDMPKTSDLRHLKVLLVVNSFKLHLNALY